MYDALKVLHLVSAVAFIGNITVGLFWHAYAARTRDAGILAYTLVALQRSDVIFTRVGAIGLLASGLALVWIYNFPFFTTPWLVGGLALFVAAGATFGIKGAPLRRQMLELAQQGVQSGAFDADAYATLASRYHRWVGAAVSMPWVGLVIMVLKPS